jgi:serine/threonine protein kinase
MAAVIRARDMELDRTVALKILPPEMAANPENILRFHQEARAAAKLDHENIARVFYCGQDQELHFIAFEFVEGETLRALVERRGALPVEEAINYLLQIATGLAHAAQRGVVHRDIKPSNLIITPAGRAKLVDMGLARSLATPSDLALTQSGVTLGTFDYISPEQALEPRDADVRSDIYSLGCTFYHVLTGHAAVPEGTAAKKLHHHQNVGPVDPRQLNPEIPDELAGILARMMAKDPKDRYQRPEHLVQHLLVQAHKLGAIPELPNDLLFVDTPLPSPPRLRPAWMLAAAILFLFAFVVIQQILSRPEPASRLASWNATNLVPDQEQAKSKESSNHPDQGNNEKKDVSGSPPVVNVPREISSARELVTALQGSQSYLDLRLTTELIDLNQERDLWGGGTPGLIFAGQDRKLTIQPKNPGQRPTIKLTYNADLPAAAAWSALTVRGGEVILRHLRFAVDATEAPGIRMAAVRLQEGGQLTLEDCEFEQVGAPSTGQLTSILMEGSRGEWPSAKLVVSECYFGGQERNSAPIVLGGQDAVTLEGTGVVQIRSCAFAPHTALVHFLKGSSGGKASLEIKQTSAIMTEGSAFLVEKGVAGHIQLQQSLFSCPNNRPTMLAPALVHQKGGASDLTFVSRGNCYHNLDDFWIVDGQSQHRDWPAEDQVLSASPWLAKDPLASLKEGNVKQAFQLDPQKAELHLQDRLVGVRRCTWGGPEVAPAVAAAETKKAETAGTLIVDPAATKAGSGIYPTLDGAVADAKPGDTILLKHIKDNRVIKVDMIRLEKPDVDLTIKPFDGYHPILSLGQSSDPEAGIFRLHDGKLRLKDLEFLIASDATDFQSRAVVTIVGDGECAMSNCLATLDKADNNPDRDLALLTVLDTANVMKMQPQAPRASPELRLEDCFVRGKGELLAVRSSRLFRLQVDKSLVALDGNFLTVKGSARDVAIQPPAAITLTRVTTYLTGHLLWLRATAAEQTARNSRGLVQTQITSATDCLFAAAAGRSLIHLDGIDQPEAYFIWTENRNNLFSNFKAGFLDQQAPKDEIMPPPPYDKSKWESVTSPVKPLYLSVRFASASLESPFTSVTPSDFRVIVDGGSDLQDHGAIIKELPVPRGPSQPGG